MIQIIESALKFGSMNIRSETEKIIIHHSGVSVLQSVYTIHDYHKNTNGWAGIGYHFYVRKNGNIYRGRPENTVGAHCSGENYNSIGICFEGNFEKEEMNEEQLKAGRELVNYLKDKYKINKVKKHNDYGNTDCPGKNFPFNSIKKEIEEEYRKGHYIVNCDVLTVRSSPEIEDDNWLRYDQLTSNAKKQIYEIKGMKVNGLVEGVECDVVDIIEEDGYHWGRIPSGWIALEFCKKGD